MKKSTIASFIVILSITSFLTSCGKDKTASKSSSTSNGAVDTVNSSTSVKQSYQFTVNGCDTGKHEFVDTTPARTLAQVCAALQNNSLNNYCAESARRNYFSLKCSGQKWSSY